MTLAAAPLFPPLEGLAGKNQGQAKGQAPEPSRPGTGHGTSRSAFNPCDAAWAQEPSDRQEAARVLRAEVVPPIG